jgi:molybdate transport system substrate-binding protein
MNKRLAGMAACIFVMLISAAGCKGTAVKTELREITAFCGAASETAMYEAAKVFEQGKDIRVNLIYGGSGAVLSQMKLSKTGDLYIPGSPDYIVIAARDGVIKTDTTKIVSYLVPAILVQHGNPKNIRTLADLARPGIKVGIGTPETVCVGLYAIEILEFNNFIKDVVPNIITNAESCSKAASLIALKSVDAVIGWTVFADWHPETIDVVYLDKAQIPRIAYIPAAVSIYSKDSNKAISFIDFLTSAKGQEIFKNKGYITAESEAKKFAPSANIGGEYVLPDSYKVLRK